jgi:hypothetical protein
MMRREVEEHVNDNGAKHMHLLLARLEVLELLSNLPSTPSQLPSTGPGKEDG